MKKILAVIVLVVLFIMVGPTTAMAAPNENASHVANCATMMGGQHVADCAQMMEQGVSRCARMTDPCEH